MNTTPYAMGQPVTRIEPMAISQDEKAFFVQLGARIAQLRKTAAITQVQMAERLGVSQQTVNSYEVGRRRVPVSMLPALARMLGVSVEELIGEETKASKRGPSPKIQQQLERIAQLPRARQQIVMQMLDGVLQQQTR